MKANFRCFNINISVIRQQQTHDAKNDLAAANRPAAPHKTCSSPQRVSMANGQIDEEKTRVRFKTGTNFFARKTLGNLYMRKETNTKSMQLN